MLAADDCVGWLGTGIAWPARHAPLISGSNSWNCDGGGPGATR